MNKKGELHWSMGILILFLVVTIFILIYQNNEYIFRDNAIALNKTNQEIFSNGSIYGQNLIAYEQAQTGNIYLMNQSGKINYYPIKTLCEGLNGK